MTRSKPTRRRKLRGALLLLGLGVMVTAADVLRSVRSWKRGPKPATVDVHPAPFGDLTGGRRP